MMLLATSTEFAALITGLVLLAVAAIVLIGWRPIAGLIGSLALFAAGTVAAAIYFERFDWQHAFGMTWGFLFFCVGVFTIRPFVVGLIRLSRE